MKQLTSKERLIRAIKHQDVDRVPISPRYFDYLLGVEGCSCVHHCIWMAGQYEHDLMPTYIPPQNNYLLHHVGAYNDLAGVAVSIETQNSGEAIIVERTFKTPAGALRDVRSVVKPGSPVQFDHIIEAPVKNRNDLDKVRFLLPPPDDAYIGEIPLLKEAIGDRGTLLVKATQGVDQMLMDALGVQHALLTYYDDRQLISDLLRIFQDYHRAILKRVLEQGIEVVFEPWYNCSTGAGWSPDQFREMFLPLIRENVDLVHSYDAVVDYYDDGKMDRLLEDLADAEIDIVETLGAPPMGDIDLASAKARIGDRVCLKGHIDQVNLICFGRPDAIREAVGRAIEVGAPGSGFIIGTTDSIRPESPPENIKAYFDAALEYGKRDA